MVRDRLVVSIIGMAKAFFDRQTEIVIIQEPYRSSIRRFFAAIEAHPELFYPAFFARLAALNTKFGTIDCGDHGSAATCAGRDAVRHLDAQIARGADVAPFMTSMARQLAMRGIYAADLEMAGAALHAAIDDMSGSVAERDLRHSQDVLRLLLLALRADEVSWSRLPPTAFPVA